MSITIEQAIELYVTGTDVVVNNGKISFKVYKKILEMEKAASLARSQPSKKIK